MKHAARFFEYARKRHQITLDRAAGLPKPWTTDKILQDNKFCSVFREDDRTTIWFRKHVRNVYDGRPEVLLATVVFRIFNRIQTGEAIFCQQLLPSSRFKQNETTAFDIFAATGDPTILRNAIKTLMPKGPYTTGSYIISSPPGYEKLEGVLEILARFWQNSEWRQNANVLHLWSLEQTWDWLKEQDYLGKFHSYEIVTDLRHTHLLRGAPDILTWASPGPGARRGLNRIWGRPYRDTGLSREQMIEDMRALLSLSRDARFWPQVGKATKKLAENQLLWPAWEMREVEHTLCEWDKFERTRLGQGRPRGKFDGR